MTERFFEDINPEIIPYQLQAERAMADYADAALQNSVISVEVKDCRHKDIRLPKALAETMSDLPKKPKSIEAVDLRLKYDPTAMMFLTMDARLRFNTKYAVVFHRITSKLPGLEEPTYFSAVTNPVGNVVRKSDSSIPLKEREVSAILGSVGINVPESPQAASWDEIKDILRFAGVWTAQTTNTTPIDPAKTVTISDCVEGSSRNRLVHLPDNEVSVRNRVVTFSIDQADQPTEPPKHSWKLTATSENRYDTPTIKKLERVPLEFRLPRFDDYDMEILGELPYVRHELTDQTVEVPLNVFFLQAVRQTIKVAADQL